MILCSGSWATVIVGYAVLVGGEGVLLDVYSYVRVCVH